MLRRATRILVVSAATVAAQTQSPARDALIARAKSFELNTPYVAPPGDALAHHASGLAKVMCSAVFITGLDPDFAATNVGYFTAPSEERSKLGRPVIDRANSAVHVSLPNGVTRTAKRYGDQGCVTLPIGSDSVSFTPKRVLTHLLRTQPWPMGDAPSRAPLPDGLDAARVAQAVDLAFADPEALTAGMVVVYKGQIVAMMDTADLRNQVLQQEANLQSAITREQQARAALPRALPGSARQQ